MKKIIITIIILLLFVLIFADMKSSTIAYFEHRNIPSWIIVILISMLPIFELRGSIPVAVNIFHMNIFHAYILSVIGNMLPVIPILLFLEKLYKIFSRWSLTKKLFDRFFEQTKSRSQQVEKYKMLGLIAFVAIPLPITGAWTGSAAAVIFNIKMKHSILSIMIGVLIAGVIVSLLSVMGIWGALIGGIAILASIIFPIMKSKI